MTELSTGHAPPFAAAASETLQALRTALLNIFETRPGGIGRSRDAQRALGINAKLSWQLFRLAAPGDPLTLSPHVPSALAMRGVFAAAVEHDVPAGLIEQLALAFAKFEALVETHAGDRASFDSMIRAVTQAEPDRGDLAHRRNMFRACSHYWGLQVDTYFTFGVLYPSAADGLFDYANVRCKLGLSRLRADASVIVDSFKLQVAGTDHAARFLREPLDPDAADRYGAPVLAKFCTQPLPELRTHTDPDGTTYSELINPTVGRQAAVDMAFGEVSRASPLSPGSGGRGRGFGANVRISSPTARLVSDMLVHRPTLPRLHAWLKVFGSNVREDGSELQISAAPLPFTEHVRLLEQGPAAAAPRDVPQYAAIVREVCAQSGWDFDALDVYRTEIEYPLMHTRIAMGFDLPA